MTPTLGQAARFYADYLGLPVFPLQPQSKLPYKGSRGFKDATCDPDQATERWAEHPTANIGLACGQVVDVLDLDGPTGKESFAALAATHDLDPGGWPSVASGRPDGGVHYYFAATGLRRAPGFRPKLDWLGAGGYCVLPPSRHPSGRIYAWQGDGRPPEVWPDAPEVLVEAVIARHLAKEQSRPTCYDVQRWHDGTRAGDDYNRRGDVVELLREHGWTVARQVGDEVRLVRPHKTARDGISATLNHHQHNELFVFTDEAPPFEVDTCYTPFRALALLRHDGDWAAAAKALYWQGWGEHLTHHGKRCARSDCPNPCRCGDCIARRFRRSVRSTPQGARQP